MGVRDVGEVPGGAWRAGHAAGDDDGRREGRKRDAGMVGGRGDGERGGTGEPGGDRIGIDDGAGGESRVLFIFYIFAWRVVVI